MKIPRFDFDILGSILGESSILDIPRLRIYDSDQAAQFIHTYGYNLSNPKDLEKLWTYHRSAIEFLESDILHEDEKIPASLRNKEELRDIAKLILIAGVSGQSETVRENGHSHQVWACAILRVMHVLVHLDNDLFTAFTDDIKYQILKPFQDHIYYQDQKTFLGKDDDAIEIVLFAQKPFKHTSSAAIKLLTRRNALAMTLLDRVGIRFVTKDIVSIFRVIQYLVDKHLISYPHVIASQSKNTICPTKVFLSVLEKNVIREDDFNVETIENALREEIKNYELKVDPILNPFSSDEFKFLKFINRQFLRIEVGKDRPPLTFFYPFEIQILDQQTFDSNESGKASHAEYKKRQRESARLRIFGIHPS